MSIALDKIRAKLQSLAGGGKSDRLNYWKPEAGEYKIRILPWKTQVDEQPFREKYFYYIGDGPGMLALSQFKEPDPIQELMNKLYQSGKKEDKELAKQLWPKMRCYAPIIVRGREDEGVQVWSFGKFVYTRLLEMIVDPDIGDITDPKNGFDLKVKLVQKGASTKYFDTIVDAARSSSPLADNKDKIKELLDSVPDIDANFKKPTYDDLKQKLQRWLDAESVDASDGEEKSSSVATVDDLTALENEIKASKKPAAKKAKSTDDDDSEIAPKKSFKDIDSAFADLEED